MVLDNGLLNVLTVDAPHSGKLEEEKESFWNEVFHLVSCIPQNETVVLAGDMNGHVGSSNAGYDRMHGGFGYGDINADGSRILEFADGLNLVSCSTLFMKQASQLVTYTTGPVKSMVDYIILRQTTKQRFIMSRSFQMKNMYQSIGSLNQEYVFGNSRRKRQVKNTKAWSKIR